MIVIFFYAFSHPKTHSANMIFILAVYKLARYSLAASMLKNT